MYQHVQEESPVETVLLRIPPDLEATSLKERVSVTLDDLKLKDGGMVCTFLYKDEPLFTCESVADSTSLDRLLSSADHTQSPFLEMVETGVTSILYNHGRERFYPPQILGNTE